jgi:glutamine synthetase
MNKVWLFLTDLHGIVRGKLLPLPIPNRPSSKIEFLQTEFSGIFVNDIFDRPVPNLKKAEEQVNMIAIPSSTGVVSPWDSSEVYYICNAYLDENGKTTSKLCPRSLLMNAMKSMDQLGFLMKCGVELEWTMLQNNEKNEKEPILGSMQSYSMLHYENPAIQSFLGQLVEKSRLFPTQIEALHAESGNSIFEAALSPSDPSKTSDAIQLYRMTIRRLARENNMHATFMPKPYPNSAGCGMHIHMSLNYLDGTSAKEILFNSFLAGLLCHLDSSLILLLPYACSFHRMRGEFWTTNHVSYGIDSRLDAIRLVHHDSNSGNARIELRIAGGDANPYLVLYYCIKAGMWGVEHNLSLEKIGLPGQFIKPLPTTLEEASLLFMNDNSLARQLYGDAFVDHYGQQCIHESNVSKTLGRPEGWEMRVF